MDLSWVTSIWLPLVTLAAYRLTRLWIDDALPPLPRVRDRLRLRIEARWERRVAKVGDPYDDRVYLYWGNPPLLSLINCYWCSGFWITLATIAGATFLPFWLWALPVLALALSAVVGIIAQLAD